MAVKIRLTRRGRKKLALYDVVVADARAPRDGRFIEKLGNYNPNTNPATISIDEDRAFHWVMVGAQPTDTVRAILSYKGVMYRKHLQVGVDKGAISQDDADKKLAKWLEEKRAQIQAKVDSLTAKDAAAAKKRLEAETKVNEARIERIIKKSADLQAAAVAAVTKETQGEAETDDTVEKEVATDTAPAEEAPEAATEVEQPPIEKKAKEESPATESEPAGEVEAKETPVDTVEETKPEEAKEVESTEVETAPEEDKKEDKTVKAKDEPVKAEVTETTKDETSPAEENPAEVGDDTVVAETAEAAKDETPPAEEEKKAK